MTLLLDVVAPINELLVGSNVAEIVAEPRVRTTFRLHIGSLGTIQLEISTKEVCLTLTQSSTENED
jgi:hypothetical protein